jgi:serine/threonine protein kinase
MPLSAGDKLGPYELLAPIGAGGMGEVYKARDTRLDRIVAVKVSKEDFSERFEREARAVAALNHPHICALYDVGPNYLVMEYVEGAPLISPKNPGPLPLVQALKYAGEICEALSEAHSKGVTHRDLKPANILVTKSAGIKLLDFGLARVDSPVRSHDETLTMALTQKGQIMGTLFYMSPEQVQGKETGPASDIFSFGLVLYEMLTGKRAFEGSNAASVIAAILERPAPSVAGVAPAALDRVLKRCLEKDPENRWRNARDLGAAVECVSAVEPTIAVQPPPEPVKPRTRPWPWAVAAVFAVAAMALGFIAFDHKNEEPPRVLRVPILPPEGTSLPANGVPALSPDGRKLAFAANRPGKTSLWVRDLDSLTARELPGTDGASLPFWSPDGRYLGFFAGAKLKRTDATGGSVLTICDAPNGRGGTWNQNDVIAFVPGIASFLFRVSAAGGTAAPLTKLVGDERAHRYPWFLPDGRHFLYTVLGQKTGTRNIYVGDLESGERREIGQARSSVAYAAPGYLLFVRETSLLAQPFSLSKLQTTGDPIPIAEHVSYQSLDIRALFTSSQTGMVAYVPADAVGLGTSQLTWVDRSGKQAGVVGAPARVLYPTISPDGNSVAASIQVPQTGLYDIWIYDLKRGTASPFTFNSRNNSSPVWSPDGSHLAFSSNLGGPDNIYRKPVAGGADEALESSPGPRTSWDWSRDDRYIIEQVTAKASEIWVLPLFGDRKAFPYLQGDYNQRQGKLSPNGRWLAYGSDESKRLEVYIRSFPTPSRKWQVSMNGGSNPIWSRDGKELFFIAVDGRMMAVDVTESEGKFSPGVPKALFDAGLLPEASYYDVAKDGRFLLPKPVEQGGSVPLEVIVNWPATLKK